MQLPGLLTYKDMELIWPYGHVRLHHIEMYQEMDHHARMQIIGMISEDQENAIINHAASQDPVELWYTQDDQKRPLFMGQIYNIELQGVHNNLQITLEIVSHSFNLDMKLKERSFQQIDCTYMDIVDSVLDDYPRSDRLDEAFGDRLTGQFIMQYQETDWDFLRRLASHAGAMLLPNITMHGVQIWIGLPEARRHIDLKDISFRNKRTIAPYMKDAAQGKQTSAIDYTRYTFEWHNILDIGDTVIRHEIKYVIVKRSAQMQKGQLVWSYECALPEGIKVTRIRNTVITGAAIEGKILDVHKNQVKIHLDIDDSQDPQHARWFPYSAEGNQVWYLMPEKGAQIKLYFPSAEEDRAMAIQSVRTSASQPSPVAASTGAPAATSLAPAPMASVVPTESPAARMERKMSDPGTKSFANPQGKEVSMSGSELALNAQEGALYLSMHISKGVNLTGNQNVSIHAGGSLELNASKISLTGADQLQMQTLTDVLQLKTDASSKSAEITMEASRHGVHDHLLSPFEQALQSKGLAAIEKERKSASAQAQMDGMKDAGVEIAKGLWGLVVDVGDLTTTTLMGDAGAQTLYSWVSGKPVGTLMERNETVKGTVEGAKAAGTYAWDTVTFQKSGSQLKSDAGAAIDTYLEPFEQASKQSTLNPLTSSKEEYYSVGYGGVKSLERVIDTVGIAKGAAKLATKAGKIGKGMAKAGAKEAAEEGAEAAARAAGGGKMPNSRLGPAVGQGGAKPGAMPFMVPIERLGAMMENLSARMNQNRLATAGVGGLDHGPIRMHSHIPEDTPERLRQKQDLKDGLYSGSGPNVRRHDGDSPSSSSGKTPKNQDLKQDKNKGQTPGSLSPPKIDEIKRQIADLNKQIAEAAKSGKDTKKKQLERKRNKLANQLPTPDDISQRFDLTAAKAYERKIANKKDKRYDHDKGDFGEEVAKVLATENHLGKDISSLFQVGRNGVDGTFLAKGPPPKLTMIEVKTSEIAKFSYSSHQKLGGKDYFQRMIKGKVDKRYQSFKKKYQELLDDNPGLTFDYIRVEVDVHITKVGFGVETLKVKDWNTEIE
ncbi:contractile injection system protein, VgrG/Pvc8 family [Paenibacillus sp. Z6-24]